MMNLYFHKISMTIAFKYFCLKNQKKIDFEIYDFRTNFSLKKALKKSTKYFTRISREKSELKNYLLTEKIFENTVRFINTALNKFFAVKFLNEQILNQMKLSQLTSLTNHAQKTQISYRPSNLERCVC